jgi:hypothetical protein
MKIEVSIGEIVDKYTIIAIKLLKIKDEEKLKNIKKEYNYLNDIVKNLNIEHIDTFDLMDINQKLWDIENHKRQCEKDNDFGELFIDSARNVYKFNDERARIKKAINIKYGSEFHEEKSY